MKKKEAKLTTQLLKQLDGLFDYPVWCEVKVVPKGHRFSTRVLSKKARSMLQYTKMTYKFSDAARLGTPLDFIHLPSVQPLLCVIFYGQGEKSEAYFIHYDGTDYLKTEGEISEMAVKRKTLV